MDNGGQYAVLGLTILMLTLSASNWDMMVTIQLLILHCECNQERMYSWCNYVLLV